MFDKSFYKQVSETIKILLYFKTIHYIRVHGTFILLNLIK